MEQGNEPEILNGLGTMGLEIFEDLPDADVIICPIGGGSGCASLIKVAQALNPKVEIIGVQAERAAAFYESWKKGERVTIEGADTVADGLAARSVFQLPWLIMKDHMSDVVLLTEDEILGGVRWPFRPRITSPRRPGRRPSRRRSKSRTGSKVGRWCSSCRGATSITSTSCKRSPSSQGRGAVRVSAQHSRVDKLAPDPHGLSTTSYLGRMTCTGATRRGCSLEIVDTVIITGFCAEYCVLSTCRGAEDVDLTPILLRDALAGSTPENIGFVESIHDVISYGALERVLG